MEKKWLLNWLKISGGKKPSGTCTITENGTFDVEDYAEAEVDVHEGADLSEYMNNKAYGSSSGPTYSCQAYLVKKLPENMELYSSGTTNLYSAFEGMRGLVTATYFNTSQIIDMRRMFQNCTELKDVPIYETANLSDTFKAMEYMFSNCNKLTDESLDNILVMCINAPANMPGRNLGVLGFLETYYPTSRIEALPHYNEFTAHNWRIGY